MSQTETILKTTKPLHQNQSKPKVCGKQKLGQFVHNPINVFLQDLNISKVTYTGHSCRGSTLSTCRCSGRWWFSPSQGRAHVPRGPWRLVPSRWRTFPSSGRWRRQQKGARCRPVRRWWPAQEARTQPNSDSSCCLGRFSLTSTTTHNVDSVSNRNLRFSANLPNWHNVLMLLLHRDKSNEETLALVLVNKLFKL